MEHLSFVIWMLLYYPLSEIGNYFCYLSYGKKRDRVIGDVSFWAAFANIFIWFYVGYLLY